MKQVVTCERFREILPYVRNLSEPFFSSIVVNIHSFDRVANLWINERRHSHRRNMNTVRGVIWQSARRSAVEKMYIESLYKNDLRARNAFMISDSDECEDRLQISSSIHAYCELFLHRKKLLCTFFSSTNIEKKYSKHLQIQRIEEQDQVFSFILVQIDFLEFTVNHCGSGECRSWLI